MGHNHVGNNTLETPTMNLWEIPGPREKPDFENLLAVLRREEPARPTLFEFYFNERLYSRISPRPPPPPESPDFFRRSMKTFHRLGYDYATILLPGFKFTEADSRETKETFSLNEGAVIRTREEFDAYCWPDPSSADYSLLKTLGDELPAGMKLIPYSPDGVLENVIRMMGFDVLCTRIYEDPSLVEDVFFEVGSRLVEYYKKTIRYPAVGAVLANDDWGFNSGTFLSAADLRRLVFPWYRDIVAACHGAGKPVILHSCGYFENIIEDVIGGMRFDGRHSYEDNIVPVEEAYERYHDRLAVLGGIDVNFICDSSPEEICGRSKAMLARAEGRGGFALGTGNSVPEYIPDENFFALIRAALEFK
jgi:uroporphyrinogen decarboxylase